jgi:replicative DNA helicase
VHAGIVRRHAILRRLRRWGLEVQAKADAAGDSDVQELLAEAEQRLIDISLSVMPQRSPYASEILREVHEDWQRERENASSLIRCDEKFSWAVPQFRPGDVWMIGGYTSEGKSTLLTQLVVDAFAAKADAGVIIFTLEDSRKEKLIGLLSNLADISKRDLLLGNFEPSKIERAVKEIREWRLFVHDNVDNVADMALMIRKHIAQAGSVDIVALDYIQNISGEGTIYERMSSAITKLCRIAAQLQVCLIVVSQISNEAMRNSGDGRGFIGLKGAGELASAPDVVLWLNRKKGEGKERFIDVDVWKNRKFGRKGLAQLMFSENYSRIFRR